MRKDILFSIIVPVYNAEKYIARCIESILVQSFKNYELILVNDGSKDRTKEILNRYQDNPNCIVIYQENSGVSVARNRGIELAKGKYICFVDADDYVADNYFETLIPLLNMNPQLISFNNYYEHQKNKFHSHERSLADGAYFMKDIKNVRSKKRKSLDWNYRSYAVE